MNQAEQRRGNTGVWTFVLLTPEGYVLARSAWGTNYKFTKAAWDALPLVEEAQ